MSNTAQTDKNLADKCAALEAENASLKSRVQWFGPKSEKRPLDNPHQPSLLGEASQPTAPEGEQQTITYQRGKAPKQRDEACACQRINPAMLPKAQKLDNNHQPGDSGCHGKTD